MNGTQVNILLVGVLLLFIFCIWRGYRKGFVRMIISMVSALLSIVLVSLLLPVVTGGIYKYTTIDDTIQEAVADKIDSYADSAVQSAAESQLEGTELEGLNLGDVDLSEYGIDEDTAQQYAGEASSDLTRQEQAELIEDAPIPVFLKNSLNENNNSEIYKILGIDNFKAYISAYITKMIVRTIAFFATLLLVWILIRILLMTVDKVTDLPVLNGVNHLFGGVLGVGWALLLVWGVFLVMALLCTTKTGAEGFAWVESSKILTALYDHNPLLHMVMKLGK